MTRQHQDISGRLLDLDYEQPAAGREKYERRMAVLFDRKLTAADWARLALMGFGGLAGATVCGALVVTEPAEMPARTRVALSVLAVIGMSWVALAGVIVRRGSINSAVHGGFAATMGFAFSLLATIGIAAMSLSGTGGARNVDVGIVLLPVVPLVLATVVLVVYHIRQAELRLRRDMLEIGYRLARQAASATPAREG